MITPWVLLVLAPLGGLGAVIRWRLQVTLPSTSPRLFTGVLVANTMGAGVAGFLVTLPSTWWSLALLVGFCGSLTTLSTLAVEVAGEIRQTRWGRALRIALVHLVCGGAAFSLGLAVSSWLGL